MIETGSESPEISNKVSGLSEFSLSSVRSKRCGYLNATPLMTTNTPMKAALKINALVPYLACLPASTLRTRARSSTRPATRANIPNPSATGIQIVPDRSVRDRNPATAIDAIPMAESARASLDRLMVNAIACFRLPGLPGRGRAR